VIDAAGETVQSQRLGDGRLAARVLVPAFAAIRIRCVPGPATTYLGPTIRGNPPVVATKTSLDNGLLRVEVDPKTGDIRSLTRYKMSGRQFVREGAGLNAYLYVLGRDPSAAVGPGASTIKVIDAGPLVATLEISSTAPGASRLVRRVSLAMQADGVDIETTIDKTLVREKESAHLAFPLNVPGGIVRADLGEAVVEFEKDQLPGSCKDFVGVTSAIDVSNAQAGVTIVSLDAPLFEIGALTDERSVTGKPRAWRKQVAPGSDVFAYLLNNYWHTNYKADQAGPMTFRFRVRPHGPFDPAELRRAGGASEQPLLAMPAALEAPLPALPFRLEGPTVVVSAVRPADDGRAVIVRLYNPTAAAASARLLGQSPRMRVLTLGASGTPGQPITGPIPVPAFGTVVLVVER